MRNFFAVALTFFTVIIVGILGCTQPTFQPAPTIASLLISPADGPSTTTTFPTTTKTSAAAQPTKQELLSAIGRGVDFLVKTQNPDGSWGTGTVTNGFEVSSMIPGSHDAYRIATTALCVMALREAGEKTAHDKGLEYLITCQEARRDDGELIYNIWSHLFQLQALSEEIAIEENPRAEATARRALRSMIKYATVVGGWNYYDFHTQTQVPSMGPTSFSSAAGLVAMFEAKKVGIELPEKLTAMTVRRLEDCRLPGGFFMYGSDYKYSPRMPGNTEKGAVGRTQPCYYALWLWHSNVATVERIWKALDAFDRNHDYLQMGRKRPIPHESWYQTAGYYYYFDHYYAARLLEALPPAERTRFAHVIISGIVQYQEPDGSWWDFPMWDYHKPYGTAFAIMALLRCREE